MELWMKSAKEKPLVEKTEQGQERPGEAPDGCQVAGQAHGICLSGQAVRPVPSAVCSISTDE